MMNLTLAIIALVSVIVAAVMTFVAWTTVRGERRRAAARVAALTEAIHERDDLPLRQAPDNAGLFVRRAASSGTRIGAAGVVSLLVVGAITGLVVLGEGGSRRRPASAAPPAAQPADVPLELVALEHDRDDDRLIVRGIVRNPASAATLNGLTAVVLVFSKDGFMASARAPAAVASLRAGAETPFVVTLTDADWVDRFRVSFRAGDRVVPHIDRRSRNAIARTE